VFDAGKLKPYCKRGPTNMLRSSVRTATFTALFVASTVLFTACSGGGGRGGDANVLRITITDINQQFAASQGVIGITFDVIGPGATVYNLIVRFSAPGTASQVSATQVPIPLANAINAQNPGAGVAQLPLGGLVLPPTDGPASTQFVYWWYAGANLGFLSSEFTFGINPVTVVPNLETQGDVTPLTSYLGSTVSPGGQGLPSNNSGGPGAGSGSGGNPTSGSGRAGHTATHVGNDAKLYGRVPGFIVSNGNQVTVCISRVSQH
jgi:hypothetical protein